jgi:MFS family permease
MDVEHSSNLLFGDRLKLKVVQNNDGRSDEILDSDPATGNPRFPIEPGELDHDDTKEGHDESVGIRASLSAIFSWKNYRTYLITAWVFNAFEYLSTLMNLYLWDIIPNFVIIGAFWAVASAIAAVARFFGGYVGDTVNRKTLSVVSMFLMAIYHVMIGIFIDPIFIFVALIIVSSMEVTKGGSSAYIMDNIPREHSGLALSLFTAGRTLSIITLAIFAFLFPMMEFEAYRQIHLVGGILLLGSTLGSAVFLESNPQQKREAGTKLWRSFLAENSRAFKILLKILPGMMLVCFLDAISDSFFKLGALIYINSVLLIDVQSIVIMMIATLVIQVPLLLKLGRRSDRKGVKSTALVVYTLMPISAALLLIAYWIPDWAPISVIEAADLLVPGLGVIFKVSFLAVVLKYVNDALWYVIMLILIRKRLPSRDTSKILSMFWFVIYIASSVGPFIGGVISEYINILFLFVGVLILNLIILGAIARYDLTSKGISFQDE